MTFDPFAQTNPWQSIQTGNPYGTPGFAMQYGQMGAPFGSYAGANPFQTANPWTQFGTQGGFGQVGMSPQQLAPQTWFGNPFAGAYGANPVLQQIPHLIQQANQLAQTIPQLAQTIPQLVQQNPQLAQQAPQLQHIPQLLQQVAQLAHQIPQVLHQVYASSAGQTQYGQSPYTQNPYAQFAGGALGQNWLTPYSTPLTLGGFGRPFV